MDLLGPFPKTPRGNLHLLLIEDSYINLVRTVPLQLNENIYIARSFLTNWVYIYCIFDSVMANNGKQLNARLMLEAHLIVGFKELFTTTYHPQTNGQTELVNGKILSALQTFFSEHPID